MIIIFYLEIFIWLLIVYAFADVIVPLMIGKRPFVIARSVFCRKKQKNNDNKPSGKRFRSNRVN